MLVKVKLQVLFLATEIKFFITHEYMMHTNTHTLTHSAQSGAIRGCGGTGSVAHGSYVQLPGDQ